MFLISLCSDWARCCISFFTSGFLIRHTGMAHLPFPISGDVGVETVALIRSWSVGNGAGSMSHFQ